jgi:hypothetical protein
VWSRDHGVCRGKISPSEIVGLAELEVYSSNLMCRLSRLGALKKDWVIEQSESISSLGLAERE